MALGRQRGIAGQVQGHIVDRTATRSDMPKGPALAAAVRFVPVFDQPHKAVLNNLSNMRWREGAKMG